MTAVLDPELDPVLLEDPEVQALDEFDAENEIHLAQSEAEMIEDLVLKIIKFGEVLCQINLFPYQRQLAHRVIESLVIGDGEEITALQSRQSGKTEVLSLVISSCMVLLPILAKLPQYEPWLGKFAKGFKVGVFAPTDEQSETLHSRVVTYLTTDHATELLLDPEINEAVVAKGRLIKLRRSGSFCRRQTANPRAKIESKTYQLVCLDEAQEADDFTVSKSIHPMLAFDNGTIVKTGTPNRVKGNFYRAIKLNKRRQTKRGARQNHFEFDWRHCARYNENYRKFIRKEMVRIGQDSDEFQLSYELKWLLDRGMFVTDMLMDALGDKKMEIVPSWFDSPVVVGIDPAKSVDSTVVTVVWVNWDRHDEFGYFEHRVLNWLELTGENWEEQYFQIIDFLKPYRVWAIAVDGTGVGDVVADRLQRLMPHVQVVPKISSEKEQSVRWKHLNELMGRRLIAWPAHAKTRRLKKWQRFYTQMTDAEKVYRGPNMVVAAPDETDAHDDYPDSLALACSLTQDMVMPEVQVEENPFYSSRVG